MNRTELIERLADKEHAGWAHWMAYLFSVSEKASDGSVVIPVELVERWQMQVATPYMQLTEGEKQSDRNQVNLILPLIDEYVCGNGESQSQDYQEMDLESHPFPIVLDEWPKFMT